MKINETTEVKLADDLIKEVVIDFTEGHVKKEGGLFSRTESDELTLNKQLGVESRDFSSEKRLLADNAKGIKKIIFENKVGEIPIEKRFVFELLEELVLDTLPEAGDIDFSECAEIIKKAISARNTKTLSLSEEEFKMELVDAEEKGAASYNFAFQRDFPVDKTPPFNDGEEREFVLEIIPEEKLQESLSFVDELFENKEFQALLQSRMVLLN